MTNSRKDQLNYALSHAYRTQETIGLMPKNSAYTALSRALWLLIDQLNEPSIMDMPEYEFNSLRGDVSALCRAIHILKFKL